MLFVLTALAILPDDLASRKVAEYQGFVSQRIVNLTDSAGQFYRRANELEDHRQTLPANSEAEDVAIADIARYRGSADIMWIEINQLKRASELGPPFASAVWRVGAAPKKGRRSQHPGAPGGDTSGALFVSGRPRVRNTPADPEEEVTGPSPCDPSRPLGQPAPVGAAVPPALFPKGDPA